MRDATRLCLVLSCDYEQQAEPDLSPKHEHPIYANDDRGRRDTSKVNARHGRYEFSVGKHARGRDDDVLTEVRVYEGGAYEACREIYEQRERRQDL